jgi:stearoyl-CoA desaturase (delta-9 desaturase)
MLTSTAGYQATVYVWSRDHRVHHKFADTDADPYNARRGFFFSHCGWLMCKKLPEVSEAGKQVDCSDLRADPIVRFQEKYWNVLMPTCCFILPTIIPHYFWGETLANGWFVSSCLRWAWVTHCTW